jgi:large subunit ribosomal protein L35
LSGHGFRALAIAASARYNHALAKGGMARAFAWPLKFPRLPRFSGRLGHYQKGRKMPKLKTKSGAKKRFSLTATGKVKFGVAGKRHGMSKRPNRMLRQARRTTVASGPDAIIIKKNFLPNG